MPRVVSWAQWGRLSLACRAPLLKMDVYCVVRQQQDLLHRYPPRAHTTTAEHHPSHPTMQQQLPSVIQLTQLCSRGYGAAHNVHHPVKMKNSIKVMLKRHCSTDALMWRRATLFCFLCALHPTALVTWSMKHISLTVSYPYASRHHRRVGSAPPSTI